MSKFTDMLSHTRKTKSMTRVDVAKLMGWTPMYYGRYENGHLIPTGANLDKFANFLGISRLELTIILKECKESEMNDKAA